MVLHCVFLHRVPVELEAEAGTLGKQHNAIGGHLELFSDQLSSNQRLREGCGQELDIGAVPGNRGKFGAMPMLPNCGDSGRARISFRRPR